MRKKRRADHEVDPAIFDAAADNAGLVLDDAQRRAIAALTELGGRGVYLHGPPGRGKSWLMSVFADDAPSQLLLRKHFHEFFGELHRELANTGYDLGAALRAMLGTATTVCFDEFHVHDPADGIFISRLMAALFDRGTRVVLTSNYAPGELMPNPMFHNDFLPTIALLERNLTVVSVDGELDYRTMSKHVDGFSAGSWTSPAAVIYPAADEHVSLSPAGHRIKALRANDHEIWFDFADICTGTTAPVDYLALAGQTRDWTISGVPDLAAAGAEAAQRFANLIDVLYDKDMTTTIVASATLSELAECERLPRDIDRIMSRLTELKQQSAG